MDFPNLTIILPASQPEPLPELEAFNPWDDREACVSYEEWARLTDGGQYDLDGPFSKDGYKAKCETRTKRKYA